MLGIERGLWTTMDVMKRTRSSAIFRFSFAARMAAAENDCFRYDDAWIQSSQQSMCIFDWILYVGFCLALLTFSSLLAPMYAPACLDLTLTLSLTLTLTLTLILTLTLDPFSKHRAMGSVCHHLFRPGDVPFSKRSVDDMLRSSHHIFDGRPKTPASLSSRPFKYHLP
jgi:hypothetical protein